MGGRPAITPSRSLDNRAIRDRSVFRSMVGYHDATDEAIFTAARNEDAVVMTKDLDFVDLVERHGAPPQVIWITMGNTSNARMRQVLETLFPGSQALLERGESVVEIRDKTD